MNYSHKNEMKNRRKEFASVFAYYRKYKEGPIKKSNMYGYYHRDNYILFNILINDFNYHMPIETVINKLLFDKSFPHEFTIEELLQQIHQAEEARTKCTVNTGYGIKPVYKNQQGVKEIRSLHDCATFYFKEKELALSTFKTKVINKELFDKKITELNNTFVYSYELNVYLLLMFEGEMY